MDVDKLKVTVDELDKNTGRIVLPNTPEELDALAGRVKTKKVSKKIPASVPALKSNNKDKAASTRAKPHTVGNEAMEQEGDDRFSLYEMAAVIGLLALGAIAVLLGVQNKMLGDQLKSQQAEVGILREAVSSSKDQLLKGAILEMADETVFLREEIQKLNDYFLGEQPAEVTEVEAAEDVEAVKNEEIQE